MKLIRSLFRIILFLFFVIIIAVTAGFISLFLPGTQKIITAHIRSYITDSSEGLISCDSLYASVYGDIRITGIFTPGAFGDTLMYAPDVRTSFRTLSLLENEIFIDRLELYGSRINIAREPGDSTFNYDYIIRKFSKKDTSYVKNIPEDTSHWKYTLNRLIIEDARYSFRDSVTWLFADFVIGKLDVSFNELDINRLMKMESDELHIIIVDLFKSIAWKRQKKLDQCKGDLQINSIALKNVRVTFSKYPLLGGFSVEIKQFNQ